MGNMVMERNPDAFVMMEVFVRKDDAKVMGVVVGSDVITPVSINEVKLWENAVGDFIPTGKKAKVLSTLSKQVELWKAPGHSVEVWNYNEFGHWGSHLKGAFKESGIMV